MKAGLFTLAALSAVAVAQPAHNHRHRHAKKDVAYVTDVEYVTATAQGPVVYVDANGNPISTSYPAEAAPTVAAAAYSAPAPVAPAPSPETSAYVAPSSAAAPPPPAYTAPAASSAPAYSAPASSSSAAPPATSSEASSTGHGITYSPYKGDGNCKSADEVTKDFGGINGYGIVRIYGTDCNQVPNVLSAATAKGMKVFAGIYNINNVAAEAQLIIDAAKSNWGAIDTVSVGNEGVNSGQYTVDQVAGAVSSAKSILSGAGYSGPVVTVDTFVAIIANPGLCNVGDYVAANCHAFFDSSKTADEAGAFVLSQVQRVSAACGGKKTVITESGWPSAGSANGAAIPSPSNQQAAVSSIKSAFSSNIFLFTAYNDYWKKDNAGTFGAEHHYGILGDCPSG
nr:hypothetical protein B0A51_02921 [Rachicladosporium sp. CCFEE 5018]